MTTAAPPREDIDTSLFDELDEALGRRCENKTWSICPRCGEAHDFRQCDHAAEWLVVIRNCGNDEDCHERSLCAHALCTRHRDVIAAGRMIIAGTGARVQIVSCEPIWK